MTWYESLMVGFQPYFSSSKNDALNAKFCHEHAHLFSNFFCFSYYQFTAFLRNYKQIYAIVKLVYRYHNLSIQIS